MTRVVAACRPASDAGFSERVRHVIDRDQWDLGSIEGVALIQAVLRQSYPMASVVGHDGVWAGGVRRTVVLDIYRDGTPNEADEAVRWVEAVYALGGAAAYRAVVRILGEGPAAEETVEQAFQTIRRSGPHGLTVAAGAAAVEATSVHLAHEARVARGSSPSDGIQASRPLAPSALAETSLRKGPVQKKLSGDALACVTSSQRAALELSLLEDLKVAAIADRMQTETSVVKRHLNEALMAVGARVPLSSESTLARWRDAQREWETLPAAHPRRPARSLAVAHAWLDYQAASRSVSPDTVSLVADTNRRLVATSAGAGELFGRASLVGLHVDDVTAEYARPLVPELWDLFDTNGGMAGEYDCDRPSQAPVRVSFRGVWGRPIPDLQVGYLERTDAPLKW